MEKIEYDEAMHAELKVDCYGGDSCEEHEPYWSIYAEGDKDGDTTKGPLILDTRFPPGTRVTVEFPICPKCRLLSELCQASKKCDFDWKQWVEDQYA